MEQKNNNNSELTTFIGIYIDSLIKAGYDASETKRMITQDITNEALTICDDGKGSYDYYGLQPIFLAVSYILEKEVFRLTQEKLEAIEPTIKKLQFVADYLKKRAELAKKKEVI